MDGLNFSFPFEEEYIDRGGITRFCSLLLTDTHGDSKLGDCKRGDSKHSNFTT